MMPAFPVQVRRHHNLGSRAISPAPASMIVGGWSRSACFSTGNTSRSLFLSVQQV
jgi:hypothetical protein